MLKNLIAAALIVLAPIIHAQVRVVESTPQGFGSGVSDLNASADTDVYSQIRGLQEEIAILRGLVEEQQHQLKQLKQLQLDNYMDLDRRLSGGSSVQLPDTSNDVEPATKSVQSRSREQNESILDTASESDVYKAAYDLLNQKDFDGAVSAFKTHLSRFPNGNFASNSHYWLGKVAMLKKDYPQAKNWFSDLITNFPTAAKVPDAQLDLGKVYFLMGDQSEAKSLLSKVASGNSDAARLAQRFLADNF